MIVNAPAALAELTTAFEAYEIALGTNDVDALDAFFRVSEETLRYGVGENLYGHDAIAAFRLARPGGSPQRRLLRVAIATYGDAFGTANCEFQRVGGEVIGRQSQTWVRFGEGWRIVAAHVSLMTGGH